MSSRGRGQPRQHQAPPQFSSRGGSSRGGRGGARSTPNPPPRHHNPPPRSNFASSSQNPPPRSHFASSSQNPPPRSHIVSSSQNPPPRSHFASSSQNPPPRSHIASSSQNPPLPRVPVSLVSSISQDLQQMLMVTSAQSSVQVAQAQAQTTEPTSSKALKLAVRPGYGTLGKRCVVMANHFLVQIADKSLHHYDVTITPEVTSKKLCRLIMQELVTCYRVSHLGKRRIAYDGVKSIYTAGELPFLSKEFIVKLDKDVNAKRDREFKVSIRFVAKPDLRQLQQFLSGSQLDTPQETIQALDVVLRSNPSMNYNVIGRSFFETTLGDPGNLGGGTEYWKGYYQSLCPTQMGLSLNTDVSARAFFEPIFVTEFVAKYLGVGNLTGPLTDRDRNKISKVLKGIKVVLTTREGWRRYKINGFTSEPLSQLTFIDVTGETISVVQYFRNKYEVNLNQTFLPAIQAGYGKKPVYLPMELCEIASGQRYTKRLNDGQVNNILRATCQRPADRQNSIRRMVRNNNYNNDEVAIDFGIQVNCELASVEARILPPPQLQYKDTLENPQVGIWNMKEKRMVDGGTLDFWTCVNFSRLERKDVEPFCRRLVRTCNEKGMFFNAREIIPFQKVPPTQIELALLHIQNQSSAKIAEVGHAGKQLQLLIIILPSGGEHYGKIKRICETELGIVSQCCRPDITKFRNARYLEYLSLKINVKVGGSNTVLVNAIMERIPNLTDRPTIIFGADVTHPSAGEDSSPSVAAVVASMDWPQVTKYRGLISAQPPRDEIIHDLYTCSKDNEKTFTHGGLIREQLMAFYRLNKVKPHRIIFFRDGVSDGQFSQVLLHEVDAIRKACESLEENYQPRVTFVVVQKRHHTRLFPADPRDRSLVDRSGNILPGTVVDTMICHPTEFDFYLCSHAGIQGTSRPAHYNVLFDENNFTADQLQSLINNLCYTYARCTRSVSVVPPVNYAHLTAFRAHHYMGGDVAFDSDSTGGAAAGSRERATDVRALPTIKDNVKEVMFYC